MVSSELRSIVKRIDKVFIPVDEWVPEESDIIFKNVSKCVYVPLSEKFINQKDTFLDFFQMSAKRCYDGDKVKDHLCHYLNYFLKFYDHDQELLVQYYRIKYLIDCAGPAYTKEAFMYDLKKYILDGPIFIKTSFMNEDNYNLDLNKKREKNTGKMIPSLQYSDKHGSILMHISLLQLIFIPLLVHYLTTRNIMHIKDFLLEAFNMILDKYSDQVDIYNKLYETSISSVSKNAQIHKVLWDMNKIRAKNTTTHSISAVSDIILHIMPKYTYNLNIISFNYKSIVFNIGYQITDISYEYGFVNYSSSERDAEFNSEFDKFESQLTKQDEGLYLQNKVNCEETMKTIELIYGPFSEDEINFYIKKLSKDGRFSINQFQETLVFNLYYKYFGDTISIKAINQRDYIKLIIAAKKILESNNLIIMPYILSSKIKRLITRKNVNKKELTKIQSSQFYQLVKDKYKNDKIENQILSMIASILSSEFEIIDFYDDELDGRLVDTNIDLLLEEVLMYILLI